MIRNSKFFTFLLNSTNNGLTTPVTRGVQPFNLNFGPQHPSAHGVLRLILEVIGEVLKKITPHIGLLHRGTEKLIEYKTYIQALPYFDRLDYVSMMAQEHAYVLCLEKFLRTGIPKRAQYIRTVFCEITRIMNHLLALACHALDIGALTPLLWAFEDREKLFEFYERVSGARMHAAYFRPGGVALDLPIGILADMYTFCNQFASRINELEELLTENRIWRHRLTKVGIVSYIESDGWAFSGVLMRSAGKNFDLRLQQPYERYIEPDFEIPTASTGDCFARYIIRLEEMRQSLSIITQLLNRMAPGHVFSENNKFIAPRRSSMKKTMEGIIHHFKIFTTGAFIEANEAYTAVETPKGEFGVFMATSKGQSPDRLKIRSAGAAHLQGIGLMTQGHLLGDAVAVIGSQDIVFGEVDR